MFQSRLAENHTTLVVRPSFGSRMPGIEGMRAFAACSILVLHVWLYGGERAALGGLDRFVPDLAFGVILFFTLSGFLLYRPFAATIVRATPPLSVRQYFRNRALRILPAYWVILLLCAVLGGVIFWDSSGNQVNGRLLDPVLLGRASFFLQDYSPNTLLTGIGPAWSLAVEAVFYCALPLLVLLAARLARSRSSRVSRRWAAFAPAVLLLVVGLIGKASTAYLVPPPTPYAGWSQDWHSVLERSFLCQADLFAFGMALAVLRVDSEDGALRLPRWWRQAAVVLAVGIYVFTTATSKDEQLSYSPSNTMIALACALVLALVVLPAHRTSRSRFVGILERRPIVATGVVSYSIFLWHEPLIRLLYAHGLTFDGRGGFAGNLALVAVVTAVASSITYLLVEAPALRLKFGPRSEKATPVPAAQVEAAP
jgi:peptidoglycan/LPS O-acetylase OafA/YrhL